MTKRVATVTAPTTALAGSGRGFILEPGTYPVVEIDGAAQRGEMYLKRPEDGALVCVQDGDRNVTISEED